MSSTTAAGGPAGGPAAGGPAAGGPAAAESVRYKVIYSEGARLYDSPEENYGTKFFGKVGAVGLVEKPPHLEVNTEFTGLELADQGEGWVQITEGEYSGKCLKLKKSGDIQVITPLINFNIMNLEGHVEDLNQRWRSFTEEQVVMAGGYDGFKNIVERYTTAARKAAAAGKQELALRNLRFKKRLYETSNPLYANAAAVELFNSILSVKSRIIDLGDEWLSINTGHIRRLDCNETEITTDCLEKYKLAAENFSQGVVDFLDIYLSLKNPSTAALGGGKRKRKRKSKRKYTKRRKTQKRKKSSKQSSKKSKHRKTHKRKTHKRRNKTKRR